MGMIRPADSGAPDDHDNEMIPKIDGDHSGETSRWSVTIAFLHVGGHARSTPRVSRRLAVAAMLAGAVVVIAVAVVCSPTEAWHLAACAGNVFIAYFIGH
jgi:hypothetical protein